MSWIVQNYEDINGIPCDTTKRAFKTYADAKMRQVAIAIMCFEEEFPNLTRVGNLFELRRFLRIHTTNDVFAFRSEDGHTYRVEVYEEMGHS